jgi:hypothetical protein
MEFLLVFRLMTSNKKRLSRLVATMGGKIYAYKFWQEIMSKLHGKPWRINNMTCAVFKI